LWALRAFAEEISFAFQDQILAVWIPPIGVPISDCRVRIISISIEVEVGSEESKDCITCGFIHHYKATVRFREIRDASSIAWVFLIVAIVT
jgi:hypothetical protein